MKISDLLKLSTDNLRRRKGRTALTVIGVVVGTCAIVVMISLGIATNRRTDEMLSTWSDLTQIQVFSYSENRIRLRWMIKWSHSSRKWKMLWRPRRCTIFKV